MRSLAVMHVAWGLHRRWHDTEHMHQSTASTGAQAVREHQVEHSIRGLWPRHELTVPVVCELYERLHRACLKFESAWQLTYCYV